MAKKIKIGHASISEHGTVNGIAGDSSGKEVYIQDNYNITTKGFDILLRPKTTTLAEKLAATCEAGCKNDKIGYSQSTRITLYEEAKKETVAFDLSKIVTPCNTDCSAFMAVCAIAAGCDVDPNLTTRTMSLENTDIKTFATSGDFFRYTDSVYFKSSDYLKRGDILVKQGSHTVMVLANGSKVPKSTVHVSSDSIIKIINNITAIAEKSMEAIVCITEVSDGKELSLTKSDVIDCYKWTASVSTGSPYNSNEPFVTDVIVKEDGTARLTVNGLQPNTTYKLKTRAIERKSSVEYESAYTVFTTAKAIDNNASMTDLRIIKNSNEIDKIYLTIAGKFKQAILYNNL